MENSALWPTYILWDHRPRRRRRRDITHIGPSPAPPANLSNQLCFSELFNGSRSFVVPERERAARRCLRRWQQKTTKRFLPAFREHIMSALRCCCIFKRGNPCFSNFRTQYNGRRGERSVSSREQRGCLVLLKREEGLFRDEGADANVLSEWINASSLLPNTAHAHGTGRPTLHSDPSPSSYFPPARPPTYSCRRRRRSLRPSVRRPRAV